MRREKRGWWLSADLDRVSAGAGRGPRRETRRMKLYRSVLVTVAGLIAVMAVAACGSSASNSASSSAASASAASSTSAQQPTGKSTAIRVAIPEDAPVNDVPVWIAEQEGFFAKRGLNVDAFVPNVPFSSQLAALGHQYDLVFTSQPDLIRAVASGLHDVAVFGGELDVPQDPAAGLVMSPKSGVTSIKQLAGHSVGAPSTTGNNWLSFECWLTKSGVKPSSVRGVQVVTSEVPDLLNAGRVDGALIFDPILSNLIAKGNRYLGDAYPHCFGPGEPAGYFVAPTEWAQAHKLELAKYLAAFKEAVSFIATHKSVALATYVKKSGLPEKIAKTAVIYPPEMNPKISVADMAKWERLMKQLGALTGTPPNPSTLVLKLPSAS